MMTRDDIIDYSVRMGCNQDLLNKGMATTPFGDVFCIATLSGLYPNAIYYLKNIKSPKEADYCGVYSIGARHRLDPDNYETRKNIAVTETDGKDKFVYYFERTLFNSKDFFFHGRYKYIDHTFDKSVNPEHEGEEIIFHLVFIDRPILK